MMWRKKYEAALAEIAALEKSRDNFDSLYREAQEQQDRVGVILGRFEGEWIVDCANRVIDHKVVWADDATPFTGPQVLDLLKENSVLRAGLEGIAKTLRRHGETAHNEECDANGCDTEDCQCPNSMDGTTIRHTADCSCGVWALRDISEATRLALADKGPSKL